MKRLNEIKRLQQLAGLTEIKINNPTRLPKYKEAAISIFKKIKEDDRDGEYNNDEFYDDLIKGINNSTTEEDINKLIFQQFYFNEDVQGMEDLKQEIEKKINGNIQ